MAEEREMPAGAPETGRAPETGGAPEDGGGPQHARQPYEADRGLRARAEQLLAAEATGWAEHLDERDIMRLVHEIQVHQIELEMQNEELRQTQVNLALAGERYADLYNFAPVGYLSVTLDGRIARANLTAAGMLSTERREMTGASLYKFVAPNDLRPFQGLRRRLITPDLNETAELRLQPQGGEPFWARLEIVTRRDPDVGEVLWQVAISNIDAEKRAELMLQRINEELEAQVARRTEQLTLANRQLVEEIGLRRAAEAARRQREELLEQRVAERTAQLASLLTVARDVTSTLDIDAVLGVILNELQSIVPYTACGIFLLHGQVLTLVAYNGPPDPHDLLQSQTTLDESPLLNTVIRQGYPLLIPDMLEDGPLTDQWRRHAGSLQRQLLNRSRCWLGVPMMAQGEAVGVLRMDHVQPGYFTAQHADLAHTLASQAAVAVVNARLYGQAQRVAAIEERQRLARELHDSVAQTFYSIALAAHSAKAQLDHNRDLVEHRLNHILELSEAGLMEMKALIFDLQIEGIRRDGLVPALQRHVDALAARNDIAVRADLGVEPDVALEAKEAVYGIAREALQNVVRHAGATEVSLQLSRQDDILCMEVSDNGKGFAPDAVGLRTLGLRSMRERAAASGGSVEIKSAPGEGASVRARIPAPAPAGAHHGDQKVTGAS